MALLRHSEVVGEIQNLPFAADFADDLGPRSLWRPLRPPFSAGKTGDGGATQSMMTGNQGALAAHRPQASKIHRREEAENTGLAPPFVGLVENPVLAVLARQRLADRDRPEISVDHVKIVRDPVDLIGPQMVGVGRS